VSTNWLGTIIEMQLQTRQGRTGIHLFSAQLFADQQARWRSSACLANVSQRSATDDFPWQVHKVDESNS